MLRVNDSEADETTLPTGTINTHVRSRDPVINMCESDNLPSRGMPLFGNSRLSGKDNRVTCFAFLKYTSLPARQNSQCFLPRVCAAPGTDSGSVLHRAGFDADL